ncbi:CHASE domain-containing protein [Kamptonema formosum]|uniref:CHASE domain-containing protein n=1 Tax=Kamptonema formosum TaxID=331992 RepID=UPI00035C2916|nr:CHASE domain-containing protein [Oscillatoria sp. PCC 10802]
MIGTAWYKRFQSALRMGSVSPYLPVALSICVGSGLSLVASAIVWKWELESLQAEFQRQADNLATTLERKIDEYLQIPRSLGTFYDASPAELNRQSVRELSQLFLSRYPGIFSMGFTKRVRGEEREAYEERIKGEGFPNFSILERGPKGKLVPAKERPEYFAITYIEPLEKRKMILGYDVTVEPERKAAMEKARDTGEMAVTERVIVASGEAAFLLYRPIYRKGSPKDTLTDRRESFEGYAFSVFALTDVMKYSLKGLKTGHIDFYLFDESAPATNRFLVFYDSSMQQVIEDSKQKKSADFAASGLLCRNPTACTHTFKVADRQWSLVTVPTPAFTGLKIYWRAGSTLAIGLLLTGSIAAYLLISLRHTSGVEKLVHERTEQAEKLSKTLRELQETQVQLIQSEKMSSLGQLVAGIAHEINNPVNFIYGNITHANRYTGKLLEHLRLYQQEHSHPSAEIEEHAEDIDLAFLNEDLPKILSSMKMGAERIREIVLSLRNFSRLDEAEMKSVDLHEGIDSTLLILQNRLKAKSGKQLDIRVVKEYGNLPNVECYAGQINQVFMNILSNAIDALEIGQGASDVENGKNAPRSAPNQQWPTIWIRTSVANGVLGMGDWGEEKFPLPNAGCPMPTPHCLRPNCYVRIAIADTGPGIPEALRLRIFDPFFTTKPVGKGTGLGLSISYQIVVDKHGGKLECVSTPGKGTEFLIEIPVRQSCRGSAGRTKLEQTGCR